MDDTDLSGLDPAAAREYVHGFLTTYRLTVKRRQQLDAERRTWEGRVAQAVAAGDDRLRDAARAELSRVQGELGRVGAEETELGAQVEVLQRHLRQLRAAPAMTVDADQLLAQLQGLVGEDAGLEADLKQVSADQRAAAELDALKRRMGQER